MRKAKINVKIGTKIGTLLENTLGTALDPFMGEKMDNNLTARIEERVREQLYDLLQTGVINSFIEPEIQISGSVVNIKCDIHPNITATEQMSPEHHRTHDWSNELIVQKCKKCGVVIFEDNLVNLGDNLSCSEYIIRDVIE